MMMRWWMVLGNCYLSSLSKNSTLVYRESKTVHSDLSESSRHKSLFPIGLPLLQITILLPFLYATSPNYHITPFPFKSPITRIFSYLLRLFFLLKKTFYFIFNYFSYFPLYYLNLQIFKNKNIFWILCRSSYMVPISFFFVKGPNIVCLKLTFLKFSCDYFCIYLDNTH